MVEKESEDIWTWFFKNLFEDLAIMDGFGWTFMSDKRKVICLHYYFIFLIIIVAILIII